MSRTRHRRRTDDDDMLQDGQSRRYSMVAMDTRNSVAHAVERRAAHDAEARKQIVDASGQGGLALHRPGHRMRNDSHARDEAIAAYAEADQINQNAWRQGPVRDASGNLRGRGKAGDPCTCRGEEYPEYFGAPGHLDANGRCVPDAEDARRRKRAQYRDPEGREAGSEEIESEDSTRLGHAETEYRRYNEWLTNAWRGR
jgi:hypothetical protein